MMLNHKIGYIQGLISAVFTFLQGPLAIYGDPLKSQGPQKEPLDIKTLQQDHLNSVPGITVLLFIRFSLQSFLIEVLAKLKAAAIKE